MLRANVHAIQHYGKVKLWRVKQLSRWEILSKYKPLDNKSRHSVNVFIFRLSRILRIHDVNCIICFVLRGIGKCPHNLSKKNPILKTKQCNKKTLRTVYCRLWLLGAKGFRLSRILRTHDVNCIYFFYFKRYRKVSPTISAKKNPILKTKQYNKKTLRTVYCRLWFLGAKGYYITVISNFKNK